MVNFEIMIAKTGNDSAKWLPLWMHLKDTAGIMECLVEDYISDSFAEICGLEKEMLQKTAIFLAYVHDIGKATVSFQYKIGKKLPERRSVLEHFGVQFPDFYEADTLRKTPHALAGEEILRFLEVPSGIAAIVGSHHGIPSEYSQVRNQDLTQTKRDIEAFENYYGGYGMTENVQIFQSCWKEILEKALQYSGFRSIADIPDPERSAQMILTGLLIMADWIASNTLFFPLLSVDSMEPEYENYPNRVEQAWEQVDFTEIWKSERNTYDDDTFENSFNFLPSSVQRAVLDIVQNLQKPGLLILEAPMGCGKTEAALASAELLAEKCKKKGLFFGLPTQATANGIFPRILNWAEKQSEEFYHSVQLQHGSADLNETFQSIQKGIPEEETDSGIIIHNWFCDNKKACLADFVTATVDQMLMMALKRKHVMLLHLGLAEKVVIIDEVHAYDAYMNQYLEMALLWLGAYHTPVILLSATLPATRKMALIKSYLGIKRIDEKYGKETSYPLLTWTEGDTILQSVLPYEGKHSSIEIRKCAGEDSIPEIRQIVENGGCVGVIVNTVKRAQKFADYIRNATAADVILYHAQYLLPDRAEKEKLILERIGKNSTYAQRKGLVVVGTQVLEQSLDIDFDYLVTDICPMDLLLQRIGRLHRHQRMERPDVAQKPVCVVMMDEAENENTASSTIYSDWLLHKTASELPDTILLPDEISTLVQNVYQASDESKEYREYQNQNKILQQRANSFRIKTPKGKDIHDILIRNVMDSAAEASVRDGISSIEVLVMQRKSDGRIYFLPGHYDEEQVLPIPDDEQSRRIAEQKMRLPSIFSQKWNIDKVIWEIEEQCKAHIQSWQNSHWLRGQLVLLLDDTLEAVLSGFQLHYSFENGLQYEKKEDGNEG